MKNTFGNSITITLFGESHGQQIGAILDGVAPGLEIDEEFIKSQLTLRRPVGSISTQRVEADNFNIVSGIKDGKACGTPITILIENTNTKSKDYGSQREIARPSHADFTAQAKYHGFQDVNGGGHFSGRITAPLVAAGAILIQALNKKGIYIGTHIKACKDVTDREFCDYKADIEYLNKQQFAVLDNVKENVMKDLINKTRLNGDSVGGILETAIIGVPPGIGEPWFDTIEGVIAHVLFSIPAVKGVEFGTGFNITTGFGSQMNDQLYCENNQTRTSTNHSGGINGGISNGMPIIVRCAVKPTPTIFKEQHTINFKTNENTTLIPSGRHDPCIVHRARVVADSLIALCIADLLSIHYGTDYLGGI